MLILDYSSRQDPAYLKSQGVVGVMRYLSYSAGKNITRPEADSALAAGLSIGLVWETYADRALSGYGGGASDAAAAFSQAQAVGQPTTRPIYFAVDWDASEVECLVIDEYLRGAASVLGSERVGVYGSYRVVKHCLESGAARYAWQTYAWSQGQVLDSVHLYQYSNGEWNDSVDFNEAKQADYGQWPFTGTSQEEEEMQTIRMESSTGDGRQWSGAALNENCSQVGWRIMANIASEPEVAYPFASVHAVVKIHTDEWHVVWEGDVTPTGLAGDWFPRDYNGPVSIEADQANAVSCYIIEKY